MKAWVALAAALSLTACGQQNDRTGETSATPGAPSATDAARADPAATAAAGLPSEQRTFRDWQAVCNNVNDCWAYAAVGEAMNSWIRLQQLPGPSGATQVNIGARPDPTPRAVSLAIDGRRYGLSLDPNTETFIAMDGLALARAMAAGKTAALTVDGETVPVSLSGAAAAMLWIDDRQGRLDTPTALVRRGDRAAAMIPVPPPPPAVMHAPAIDQSGYGDLDFLPVPLEELAAVKACRDEAREQGGLSREVYSARLSAQTELWAVPCFSGAYNVGHDWYLTGPGGLNPRPAVLTTTQSKPSNGTINGEYSPETGQIFAFSKGRGLGDCGSLATWTWSGRAFVLTREVEMGVCMGMPHDLWPVTWRSAEE